jgi:hypothetical protein
MILPSRSLWTRANEVPVSVIPDAVVVSDARLANYFAGELPQSCVDWPWKLIWGRRSVSGYRFVVRLSAVCSFVGESELMRRSIDFFSTMDEEVRPVPSGPGVIPTRARCPGKFRLEKTMERAERFICALHPIS